MDLTPANIFRQTLAEQAADFEQREAERTSHGDAALLAEERERTAALQARARKLCAERDSELGILAEEHAALLAAEKERGTALVLRTEHKGAVELAEAVGQRAEIAEKLAASESAARDLTARNDALATELDEERASHSTAAERRDAARASRAALQEEVSTLAAAVAHGEAVRVQRAAIFAGRSACCTAALARSAAHIAVVIADERVHSALVAAASVDPTHAAVRLFSLPLHFVRVLLTM